jgi:hypothetical protein
MLSIKEQLVLLYSTIDDLLKKQPQQGEWRKSNNKPKFTDAEVIVIAMMQHYFRTDTLQRTYLLVKANDPTAFPYLPSYKQWVARLHRLGYQTGGLMFYIPFQVAELDNIYLVDSYPIRMCEPMRHGRVNLLRDQGAYFGSSTKGWFFGFKVHILSTGTGQIIGAVMTSGNVDDRDGARMLMSFLDEGGWCIADLGYRGVEFQSEMYENNEVLFITRADIKEAELKKIHSLVRQRVETIFSELWRRFANRVYSRSWLGLWNTLQIKMLDYKLCHAEILPTY